MPSQAIDFPEVKQAQLLVRNSLASTREHWHWSEASLAFSCRPCAITNSYSDPMLVEGSFGSEAFTAHIERSVVQAILTRVDPDITVDTLPPETTAMLLEHALDAVFVHCERKTSQKLSLLRISATAPPLGGDEIGLECGLGDLKPVFVAVRGSHNIKEAVFAFARILPIDFNRLHSMRFPVSIRLAMVELPVEEIQTLAVGDMVVIDTQETPSVVLVSNEYAAASAKVFGTNIQLSTPFQYSRYGTLGDYLMSSHTASEMGTAQPIARLADMPVKIAFELGRLDVALSDLASAGEGHVFVLPTPLSNGCSLVVAGAVIGRGEVVKVGDQFAVRITSMVPR